jgi:adenylate cyclase
VATALLIANVGDQQREFTIEPGTPCRIGRHPNNSIELPDESVSRSHAMVQFTGAGSCYLYDLDSRNGTFVNGRRVSAPTMLSHGDRITIGLYDLEFVHEESLLSEATPPPSSERLATADLHQVTAMAVDIPDYAHLAQCVGETRIAEIMSVFHGEAGAVLEEMGVWTHKCAEGSIMAVWVHRSIKPPLSVVLSAFESVAKLARAAASLDGRFGLDVPVRIRAGLDTGKASIQALESRTAPNFAAFDNAVHRALRIESRTRDLDCEVAFGFATGEILRQGVALGKVAQQRAVALEGASESALLWVMSLASLSKMLAGMPPRTVRIKLP